MLVPGIRQLFHVPDGASLLAAIIVLAIMILPQIYRREEANRYAKENSSGSSIDAGQDKRQNSEGRFFCCGFPGVSQQEVQQANLPDSRDSGQDQIYRNKQCLPVPPGTDLYRRCDYCRLSESGRYRLRFSSFCQ